MPTPHEITENKLRKEIARLQDQVALLEYRVSELSGTAGEDYHLAVMRALGVTPTAAKYVCLMMARPHATHKALEAATRWNDDPDMTLCRGNVQVYVCKLRQRGIVIESVWGVGYMIPPHEKTRLAAKIKIELEALNRSKQ